LAEAQQAQTMIISSAVAIVALAGDEFHLRKFPRYHSGTVIRTVVIDHHHTDRHILAGEDGFQAATQ
jgi:hypothetical protein